MIDTNIDVEGSLTKHLNVGLRCNGCNELAPMLGAPGCSVDTLRRGNVPHGWRVRKVNHGLLHDYCPKCETEGLFVYGTD